jgi:serine/threonine protein phosphatase PrpC
MKLRSFAHTDVGRARPENEDSYLCNDALGIYAVSEGFRLADRPASWQSVPYKK